MEGTYERVIAVCSSQEKAVEHIFKYSTYGDELKKKEGYWEYVYDGEMSVTYEVQECTLDEARI